MPEQQLNNRTLDQLVQYIPAIASRIELTMLRAGLEEILDIVKSRREQLEFKENYETRKLGSEGNKIKLFIEVFNTLTSQGMNDVGTKNFIDELLKTSKFTEDEARACMKKAMQNGQIFERKAGWLSKSL
jgi:hypothetical protein